MKGTGFTLNRYIDTTRQDDTWLYLPQLRRVRRLVVGAALRRAVRTRHRPGQLCRIRGKRVVDDWKYLGAKTILGLVPLRAPAVEWLPASGNYMHDDSGSRVRS